MKTIFHVDMDAFFVSVEEIYDPTLRGKAVVVGGPADARGVVSAASYEARKFGVHSAMPLRTAYQKCPHAIFVDGHRERYVEYSRKVEAAMRAFTPLVDMASIDEAYLDVSGTGRLHGSPLAAGHKLHESIKRATGLNCSIGISTSRLVSKICSDQAKPNGVFWVVPGTEARLLAPLDVRKIPGVTCQEPMGAFYIYPNFGQAMKNLGIPSTLELATQLLTKAHVALVPGEAFGTDAHVRISYATSMHEIERGLQRIDDFIQGKPGPAA